MRYCRGLKHNEMVVFLIWSDLYKRKIPMDGNVISVDKDRKIVSVVYLEGYKSMNAHLSYYDMLAVYNPDGEVMHFDNIYGKSDLLEGGRGYKRKVGKKWDCRIDTSKYPLIYPLSYYI